MLKFVVNVLTLTGFVSTLAVPTNPNPRGILASIVSDLNIPLNGQNVSTSRNSSSLHDTLGLLERVPHNTAATPTSGDAAVSSAATACQESPTPKNIYAQIAKLVSAGLTTQDISTFVNSLNYYAGPTSLANTNRVEPKNSIFPKATPKDAPYSLSEEALRAAIHIPSTFGFGAKGTPQPMILVPGTGNTGYQTFGGNLIPLLQKNRVADAVWLNIPGQLLGDAQLSAEYVAYAINYIHEITKQKLAVVSWSQGAIDSQWAYKYWPSTRQHVTDHVAFSPDYAGTVIANFIAIPGEPLPPSVLQQASGSAFLDTLRADGGDQAYVPTTTIYSGFFDEIVEPQQGPDASAILQQGPHAGSSNNEVQQVCRGQPAGGFYLHEGTLYNPLGFALLKDALAHDGPGESSRLDLDKVCSTGLTQGLDVAEFLLTENAIAIAGISILTYPNPVFREPSLKAYAQ